MTTRDDYRKSLLTEIVLARKEYFRLKSELDSLYRDGLLPFGSYIGLYKSNYDWNYYALGHKDAVLPSARNPEQMTKKLHLGRDHNPNYRRSLLAIERLRIYQVKSETLKGISKHLAALKALWRNLKASSNLPNDSASKDMLKALHNDSVFQFVVSQYYNNF